MQARHSRGFLLVDDFTSIRHALERVLERFAIEGERRLTANRRLAVVDAQHSAPDSICASAERTRAPVQHVFARKIRLHLSGQNMAPSAKRDMALSN
jgi:hypothetical protein